MRRDPIGEVLKSDSFPGGDHARERVVAIARREIAARQVDVPRSSRLPRRLTLAVVLLIALGLASLTPPGQAATEWVNDFITKPNNFEPGSYGYQLQSSTLIGSGELSNGDRYQLRGYIGNGGDGACVAVIWEKSNDHAGSCQHEPEWKNVGVEAPIIGPLPNDSTPGASGTFVYGIASRDTSEVRIRVPASAGVDESDEAAQLFPIEGKISDTTGASEPIPPVKLFVGYLPPGAGDKRTAPPAEAVALNGDGQEIAATKLSWVRFVRPDTDEPAIMPCYQGNGSCDIVIAGDRGGSQSGRAEP
jgi:hypothetical protein